MNLNFLHNIKFKSIKWHFLRNQRKCFLTQGFREIHATLRKHALCGSAWSLVMVEGWVRSTTGLVFSISVSRLVQNRFGNISRILASWYYHLRIRQGFQFSRDNWEKQEDNQKCHQNGVCISANLCYCGTSTSCHSCISGKTGQVDMQNADVDRSLHIQYLIIYTVTKPMTERLLQEEISGEHWLSILGAKLCHLDKLTTNTYFRFQFVV